MPPSHFGPVLRCSRSLRFRAAAAPGAMKKVAAASSGRVGAVPAMKRMLLQKKPRPTTRGTRPPWKGAEGCLVQIWNGLLESIPPEDFFYCRITYAMSIYNFVIHTHTYDDHTRSGQALHEDIGPDHHPDHILLSNRLCAEQGLRHRAIG